MYDHILEEMADAIAFELHINTNNILGGPQLLLDDKINNVLLAIRAL